MDTKDKTGSTTTTETTKKPGRAKRIIIIAVLVIGVLAIGGVIGIEAAHNNAEFCSICHNMEDHVDSYVSGKSMDNVHAQAGVRCIDCHTDYTLFDQANSLIHYVTGNYDKRMPQQQYDESMCLKCHISLAYQAESTRHLVRNPHESHWPNLTCGQCHLSHDKQRDYCSRCHDNGGQIMTDDKPKPWQEETAAH